MSFLGTLISPTGLTAATQAVGAYQGAEQQASQQKIAQAIQQMQLQRQLNQTELENQVKRSLIGKQDAQAASATASATKDITGHLTGTDGTAYVIHKDGTLSPATMRGATPTPTGEATPSSDEDSTGGGVGAGPIPQQPVAPQTPTFGPKPKEPSTIPGTPEWKAAERYKASLVPHDDKVLVQVQDPANSTRTIYVPRAQAAGMATPPKGAGGMGGSLDATSRAQMTAQAKLDNAEMKRIEQRVLSGDLDFGTTAGLASAAQQAHGSPTSEAMSVLGNAAAGHLDPDIQKYITANSSYGRIMGNLQSKRYTDNQAQIEKTISGLKGNDLANTIRYKQQLRDASLAEPAAIPPSTHGAATGNVNLGVSPLRQKYDAAVAHLKATGRAAEIPNLPVPPEDE